MKDNLDNCYLYNYNKCMKIRFISLFLSLVLISISTYEFISTTLVTEKSSTIIEESLVEKKLSDKQCDDIYLVSDLQAHLNITNITTHRYKQKSYTFKLKSPLFRPPIFS